MGVWVLIIVAVLLVGAMAVAAGAMDGPRRSRRRAAAEPVRRVVEEPVRRVVVERPAQEIVTERTVVRDERL